jgi:hypothetical protein
MMLKDNEEKAVEDVTEKAAVWYDEESMIDYGRRLLFQQQICFDLIQQKRLVYSTRRCCKR